MADQSLQFFSITSDSQLAERWRTALAPLGGTHTACDSMVATLRRLPEQPIDVILLDPSGSERTVDSLFQKIRHRAPGADIIVASDAGSEMGASSIERWGVSGELPRGTSSGDWSGRISSILGDRERVKRCGWVGLSSALRAASDLLIAAAPSDATVLIEGESGTGKELAARAIHQNSARAQKPFLAVNCSAFTETILESELFGHEKGAFTDAFGRKRGVFEAADGGTIFLDEIGETSPGLQARLLRVLEERQVRRVGATESIPVDFRVVAATNRSFADAIAEGRFRRDLYFRLAVVQLTLPALRERKGDVPALLEYHLTQASQRAIRFTDRITEDAIARLIEYDWPGNVRELRNFIERMNVRFPNAAVDHNAVGELLTSVRPAMHLPVVAGRRAETVEREMIFAALSELKRDLDFLKHKISRMAEQQTSSQLSASDTAFPSLKQSERERTIDALRRTNGNRAKAAKLLGIGQRTLYRRIKEFGL
jgi:DNA-binding NtrC family response regulator